jgi:predicted outer membrane protein
MLALLTLVFTIGALVAPPFAGTGRAETLPDGWTTTKWGPLGPADREVLSRVRQACLWEQPVGEMAQTHALSQRTKEVGAILASDHKALNVTVLQTAQQLGIQVPDKPSAEQQGWVDELSGKKGADFDVTFANRLRAAHGKIFALVASVRSGTRNELVRTFAQTGINIVMKHMTVLESTTNVNFDALPTPNASPTAATGPLAAAAAKTNTAGEGTHYAIIWTVLALALLAGIPIAIRVLKYR